LPIIEYQMKELRESVKSQLPLYFNCQLNTLNNQQNHNKQHRTTSFKQIIVNNSSNNNKLVIFIQQIIYKYNNYIRKFNVLYSSPRIERPAWLTVINSKKQSIPRHSTCKNYSNPIAKSLVNDIIYLNKYFNSKKDSNNNNNFLSILLSTILKNHLSWVYSVLPLNEVENTKLQPQQQQQRSKATNVYTLRKERADWTRILERTNPYNPLWAQLSDLHGAVNSPMKLVRTVIIGKDKDIVEKLLFVLSYFIRCSNSTFYDIEQEKFNFKNYFNQMNDDASSLSSLSSSSSSSSSHSSSSSSNDIKIPHREINIYELSTFPFSQFSAAFNSKVSKTSKVVSSLHSPPPPPPPPPPKNINQDSFVLNSIQSNYNGPPVKKDFKYAKELPLIGYNLKLNNNSCDSNKCDSLSPDSSDWVDFNGNNFGYSLLNSYCDEFLFEFVLHGTKDRSFIPNLQKQLVFSKLNSILDCPIDESNYIIGDLDKLEVKVYTSESIQEPNVECSLELVDSLLKSVFDLCHLFDNSPEFILLHLEDKLQEFYTKSMTVKQLLNRNETQLSPSPPSHEIMQLLNIKTDNDLDFLNRIHKAVTLPTI
jgi:hypothetical protein